MSNRLTVLAIGLAIGLALAWALPALRRPMPTVASSGPPQAQASTHEGDQAAGSAEDRQVVKLSAEAIAAAGIEAAEIQSGSIARRIIVPGTIVPHADHIAHVAVKLPSIVAELRKNIGDPVQQNEVLAVLESREVADAKSEYLAALLSNDLQQDLLERNKALLARGVASEQTFLRSRGDAAQARMRSDIARQKLFALGLTEAEIASLPDQPEASLRRQAVRSPISGHVVERKVELGMAVGRDNLETELFVVADLARVWVELAVSPEDAPLVHVGQIVTVAARRSADQARGNVIFIAPMLDRDTRSARVVAEIDNKDGVWRPGTLVTAAIVFEQRSVPLAVPIGALQTVGTGPVVFVRTSEGFAAREVVLGQSDGRATEVVSGLRAGETIAVKNSFLLKAELLKGLDEE